MPIASGFQGALAQECANRPFINPGPVLMQIQAASISGARMSTKAYDGLVDTGADITVIPGELVRELQLNAATAFPVRGVFDATPSTRKAYYVRLVHSAFGVIDLIALAHVGQKILIGRDVLSGLHPHTRRPISSPRRLVLDYGSKTWSLQVATGA